MSNYKRSLRDYIPNAIPIFTPGTENTAATCLIATNGRDERLATLTIPHGYEKNPLCVALLNYFGTSANRSPATNSGRHTAYKTFYAWLVARNFSELTPSDVLRQYKTSMTRDHISQNAIVAYLSNIRVACKWAIANLYTRPEHEQERHFLIKALSYVKGLKKTSPKPKKSLSQVTNNVNQDELTLVRSCLRFCSSFLNVMNSHRQTLIADKKIKKNLDQYVEKCANDPSQLYWPGLYKGRLTSYASIVDHVINSTNPALKERLLINRPEYVAYLFNSSTPTSAEEANQILSKSFSRPGKLSAKVEGKWYGAAMTDMDFSYLIHHCPAEEVCLSWLLASDRIQQSGLDKLTLKDIRIEPSFASVSYYKKRSSAKQLSTPQHRSSSLRYGVYRDYITLEEEFRNLFSNFEAWIFPKRANSLQSIQSAHYKLLITAALPHTHLYAAVVGDEPEIAHFAKIIEGVARNNEAISETVRLNHHRKMSGLPELDMPVSRQSITPNIIAQSRAILDDDHLSRDLEPSEAISEAMFNRYGEVISDASSTAHTAQVKEVQYLHASTTKYRLEKRAKFASSVGNLMAKDARKVLELKKSNQVLTIAELKEKLGWNRSSSNEDTLKEFDELLQTAIDNGWTVTPFGSLEKGSTRIVIKSPIQAAMLITYQQECERLINEMDSYEHARAATIMLHSAHAQSLIERFDAKTLSEGRRLTTKYSFPPPYVI
ncbi:hypothetical protein D3C77_170590 [compost metagenome]